MKAILKELFSLDFDIESFYPDECDNFGFWLRAMIGPSDEDGSESFDIQICTPKWLLKKYSEEEILIGRHMLIVFDYDLDKIKNKIETYCKSCTGNDWQSIAGKISRLGYWEFEDYS